MRKVMRKVLMTSVALAAMSGAAPVLAEGRQWAAKSDGDWMVRARVISVIPQDDDDLNAAVETTIDSQVVPELDFTYFFTPNIAAELILATTPHEISTRGAANVRLGEVWLLPPTLTLQYHVTGMGAVKPYVGASVNYTIFYAKDEDALPFDIDNGFGWALQAGLDYEIDEGVYLNADLKKVFLSPDVSVANGAITGEVNIDPWIVGFGVGYRF